jgi:hypothetical protein
MGMIVGIALIAGWSHAMARCAAKRSRKASITVSFGFDLCNHGLSFDLNVSVFC